MRIHEGIRPRDCFRMSGSSHAVFADRTVTSASAMYDRHRRIVRRPVADGRNTLDTARSQLGCWRPGLVADELAIGRMPMWNLREE
jgi:hypothetical protein